MNKLTEIKEYYVETLVILKDHPEFLSTNFNHIGYLLSLLEEKNKALSFYADKKNYAMKYNMFDKSITSIQTSAINEDLGTIARKALNTSSNNEGDM